MMESAVVSSTEYMGPPVDRRTGLRIRALHAKA